MKPSDLTWARQRVFDIVLDHIRAQGKPAFIKGTCLYRAPDGCKCAIGALIPDDSYFGTMENVTPLYGSVVFKALPKWAQDAGDEFLKSVQREMHDAPAREEDNGDGYFLPLVERGAREIAHRYGLTYTSPRDAISPEGCP